MKKTKGIHNLDTLEKEIYRLKLQSKNIEQELDKNLDHFQDNYWTMAMNSFFCRNDHKRNGEGSFWESFSKNEAFSETINTIAGNIADKASEGLHRWMSNLFAKKKH